MILFVFVEKMQIYMKYVMGYVWYMICDDSDLILSLWVKGRPKMLHMSLRALEWPSIFKPKWASYVRYNLQGLIGRPVQWTAIMVMAPTSERPRLFWWLLPVPPTLQGGKSIEITLF